jgi:microcystin degradation protein MlrC
MTALGLEPAGKRIVIVKSNYHFQVSFAPIAKRILFARRPVQPETELRIDPLHQAQDRLLAEGGRPVRRRCGLSNRIVWEG